LGCWLRAGIGFFNNGGGDATAAATATLVDYNFLVAGTVMVGMAQPFFQCTPPLLSAKWFAQNERATSTAIALNFNQIGIATAFLIGGAMATSTGGLAQYLGLIAVATTLVTVGCLLQFQNEPPLPPSTSELEKKLKGEVEPPFLESVQKFFKTKGFTNALAAFICSIAITNVVGVSRLVYRWRRKHRNETLARRELSSVGSVSLNPLRFLIRFSLFSIVVVYLCITHIYVNISHLSRPLLENS
jgi:MFS family permease